PKPDLMKPSTDKLPEITGVTLPKVATVGPLPRNRDLINVVGKDAAAALFDELTPSDDLHDRPPSASGPRIFEVTEVGASYYVVVQLKSRKNAQVADFDKAGDLAIEDLRARRAQTAVD